MNIIFTLLKFFFVDLRYLTAFLIRLVVIIIGDILKYKYQMDLTDIDYEVFSDGAKHILNFESPYNRETYRYTPILALITIPNHLIYYNFGKILFSFVDVLVGLAIEIILNLQNKSAKTEDGDKGNNIYTDLLKTFYKYLNNPYAITSLFYLYNPVSISICTRGSADCIIAFLVLTTLIFVETGLYPIAGICYGFAIHFKIYPIIYFPCFYLYIIYKDFKKNKNNDKEKKARELKIESNKKTLQKQKKFFFFRIFDTFSNKISTIFSYFWGVVKFSLRSFLNYKAIIFAILAIATFLFYLVCFYTLLGNKFLYEYLIYHLVRKDHRHNFSIFYYLIYLTYNNQLSKLLSLVTFVPQALLVGISSLTLFHNINLCMVIVTMIFVTFNKVITAQYFLWYISLIPLIIPFNKLFDFKNHPGKVVYGLFTFLVWLALDLLWNNYSHHLEYKGKNLFLELWGVNIVFFLVNCWIIKDLITNQRG
jgi:phosphatidylinositol glycan class M